MLGKLIPTGGKLFEKFENDFEDFETESEDELVMMSNTDIFNQMLEEFTVLSNAKEIKFN